MNKTLVLVSVAFFAMVAGAAPDALVAANKLDQKWWADRHHEKLAQIAGFKDGKVDLVFIGDSITHIWESRCPDIMADINRDYTLINLGYSGDKTGNVIWRLEEGGELDGYTAKCVMLMIGTNNAGSDTAEDIAAGIKKILDLITIKQPQAKTILLPIFPRREGGQDGKPHPRPKHDQVNLIIKAYADGQKVIWCDFNAKLLDENNDTLWIMPDRLHPQTAGLEIWYDEVAPLFRKICGWREPAFTEGWENVQPGRKAFPSTEPVWQADFSDRAAFVLEKRDGAEGRIEVLGKAIRIHQTNDKGYLLIKATPFLASTNTMLQFCADVAVERATPEYSLGFLRAHGEKERLSMLPEEKSAERVLGWPEMTGLINTAPGMTYRKYTCYRSEDGSVRPVIVIAGDPSVSVWSHWVAEDHKAARALWLKEGRDPEISPKRLKPDLIPDDEFDTMIASDIQHTAKIETFGNGTRLMIDGKPAIPSLYEGMRHLQDYTEINDARGLIKAGVRIVGPIVIGAGGKSQSDSVCWSYGKPYDAKKAVDHFRETMRGSGDALMMVCYNCNAYPEFTTKEHPEDLWLDQNGEQVVGHWGSSVVGYQGMRKDQAWPWVSMASRAWREAICSNIRAFVAELKRRGLDKRLVAIHFSGYNDGQFGMNRPDYSNCAKAEYQRYLKEIEGTARSTNYWHFCRQIPARAVEEFGRAFKQAMGKDVIVLRRCDSPFVVDFGFGANCRSDVIDVTVTGPSYEYRIPSVSCSTFVPFSSMSANNKMLWNEFDLRTWWIRQAGSVVDHRSCGSFDDIACWRAGYRKLAGEMIAHRGGYWFYDMGRGWFSASGVPEDVGDSFKVFQKLVDKKPSSWKPDVAIVVDEEGFFGWDGGERGYPGHTYQIVERQIRLLGNAGIPYEYFLAEDVLKRPELLDGKKVVFFMLWRKFDDKRIAFAKRLCEKTPAVVFLAECGSLGERDEEATGFKIDFSWEAKSFKTIPESMMKASTVGVMDLERITGARFGMNPDKAITPPCGRRGSIVVKLGVVPLARFEDDQSVAIAMRRDGICRRIYVSAPGGVSPGFFNQIVRDAGGYAPVNAGCLQVNMNGDFISVHALKAGRYDFQLPFPCRVTNVKSGEKEVTVNGTLPLNMTAGQTSWFTLDTE